MPRAQSALLARCQHAEPVPEVHQGKAAVYLCRAAETSTAETHRFARRPVGEGDGRDAVYA